MLWCLHKIGIQLLDLAILVDKGCIGLRLVSSNRRYKNRKTRLGLKAVNGFIGSYQMVVTRVVAHARWRVFVDAGVGLLSRWKGL